MGIKLIIKTTTNDNYVRSKTKNKQSPALISRGFCFYILLVFISYERNGVDVSHLFRNKSSYDWYINNSQMIIMRDENFKPILTDEYNNMVAPEGEEETWVKPEPTEKDYVHVPAFTYVMGIFEKLQAISYVVLRSYIHENDKDGKWDLTT